MLHGGPGDDVIYGGEGKTGNRTDGANTAETDYKYLYGDEGDDSLFLSDFAEYSYAKGGSDDDYIQQGYFIKGESRLVGNDGDDVIRPQRTNNSNRSATSVDMILGGKGDDIINPLRVTLGDDGRLESVGTSVIYDTATTVD